MDAFVITPAVRDAAAVRNQVAIDSMGRCYHSEEDIKEVTDLAFRMSAAQASRFWNTKNPSKHVTERRVQEWKKYYTDNNRTYYKPSKRGPKEIILPEERDVLEKAFNDIRRSGTPVSSRIFACVARGIVKRSRPDIGQQDRVCIFSQTWARDEMTRLGLHVRKATTDRTVSAGQIKKEGEDFYKQLGECGVTQKCLLFNMDEFFVRLDSAGQNWT